MPGVFLPPYATPTGPELSREALIDAYLDGQRTGFSAELHIEDDMLLADRSVPFGARLGRRTVLLREDISPGLVELGEAVKDHLRSRGLTEFEPQARLGDIAAIQVTGIRGALWDLWGDDPGQARKDLERAVLADDAFAFEAVGPGGGPLGDSGIGMTIEELLGEGRDDLDGREREV